MWLDSELIMHDKILRTPPTSFFHILWTASFMVICCTTMHLLVSVFILSKLDYCNMMLGRLLLRHWIRYGGFSILQKYRCWFRSPRPSYRTDEGVTMVKCQILHEIKVVFDEHSIVTDRNLQYILDNDHNLSKLPGRKRL